METILNLLPLTSEEQEAFQAAAPGWEQMFLPAPNMRYSSMVDAGRLSEASIVIGCPDPASLKGAPRLKWLQTWSAGVDPYLVPGVLPEEVMVTSASGAYGQSVSEHMLASLLAVMKRLPVYRDNQTRHCWRDEGSAGSVEGETVLILGTGDLGRSFARLIQLFGGYPVGMNRHPERSVDFFEEIHAIEALDEWLPKAKVIASTLPGGPETYHLLDARRISLMRPDAILMNAGRGGIVDCAALAEALKGGRIWAAALDVTEPEPLPPEHPLWECRNLLLTPHVAGGDHLPQTPRKVAAIALDNLKRYAAGEPLRNRMR